MTAVTGREPVGVADWQVRVGRQGIYDRDGQVVGHELLFRGLSRTSSGLVVARPSDGSRPSADAAAGDYATSQVISATFGDFGIAQVSGGLPLYLNVTRAFLVGELPLPFGPEGVVLEILEDVPVDDELLTGVEQLRSRGFRLAVDDFVGEPDRLPLLGLVDVVKVDLLGLTTPLDDVVAICREHAPQAGLLAEKVEDERALQLCLAAGFDLFQGYHFQRPVMLETARMSPSQAVCLRLLRTLVDPVSTTADIERVVTADPGLSLRVLRTANSASGGAPRSITSLRQAVVLLGPPALSAWVMLTLMGGLTAGSRDDLVTVLARAACCESVAVQVGGDPADGAAAFTAGMLSGIAQVMRADVGLVATGAGMDLEMVRALTEGSGLLGEVVQAVAAYESGHPLATYGLPTHDISTADVSRAYLRAWSLALARVSDVLDD